MSDRIIPSLCIPSEKGYRIGPFPCRCHATYRGRLGGHSLDDQAVREERTDGGGFKRVVGRMVCQPGGRGDGLCESSDAVRSIMEVLGRSCFRPDSSQQVRGVHLLAGMLLMNMNIAVAFICLRNLLDRPCLRAFYCGIDEEVEAYYRVSSNQIQDTCLD